MTTAALVSRPRSESDRELAERHRYGDRDAFNEVYERFESLVFNLTLRIAGNRADAADCAQEAFLRIYRHLGSFEGRSDLKTWVFRITLNCCRSRFRRRATRKRVLDFGYDEHIERMVDERRDPESRASAREVSLRVHRALGKLKPIYREAVVLRDLQGLSYDEIASILGIRLGTVRSRIARGREGLREIMEPDA